MQKFKALVAGIAVATAVCTLMPAQAQSFSESFYNPIGDDSGGCAAAVYNEDHYSPDYINYWEIPTLANGESITLRSRLQAPWGTSPGGSNFDLTFTCQDGTISGGANYIGYWYMN